MANPIRGKGQLIVSIIGILVAIAVPAINAYRSNTRLAYFLTEYTLPLQNEYRKSYRIEVRNTGHTGIKAVMAIATLNEGKIQRAAVFARPGLNPQEKKKDLLNYEVDVPTLNPGENFYISLETTFRNAFANPQFVIRAEGVTGKLVRPLSPTVFIVVLVLISIYMLIVGWPKA